MIAHLKMMPTVILIHICGSKVRLTTAQCIFRKWRSQKSIQQILMNLQMGSLSSCQSPLQQSLQISTVNALRIFVLQVLLVPVIGTRGTMTIHRYHAEYVQGRRRITNVSFTLNLNHGDAYTPGAWRRCYNTKYLADLLCFRLKQ